MCGFMYRMAIGLKDFGERHKLPRLIRLGLAIRDRVMKVPGSVFLSARR
jgi:hypothetical protein